MKKIIYYFSSYDVRRTRTNQVSDVRFCEGFAENKCEVTLVVPHVFRTDNIKKKEIFNNFGIKTKFKLTTLFTPFWDSTSKKIVLPIMLILHFLYFFLIIVKNFSQLDNVVIISRSTTLISPALLLRGIFRINKIKIIFWAHEVIKRKNYLWAYKRVDAFLATNSKIIKDLKKISDRNNIKTTVTLNPVTTNQIAIKLDKKKVRKNLGISLAKPLIVYTGKIYIGQKEILYLIDAAEKFPECNFLFTGGKPHVVEHFKTNCEKRGINNIIFIGFIKNYTGILNYQFAADVLISYYSKYDHLVEYNLPQKIIEYMLTGNPIVTPDFPATQDVLNTKNAIFVEPDNLESLVKGINIALEKDSVSRKIATQAREDAEEFTFKIRTKKVIELFDSL